MTAEQTGRMGMTIVALLLIVALASVATIWTLDTVGSVSQSVFAVYLAIDLVSFAMISYVYRASKSGDEIRRVPMIAGCLLLLLLVAAGFVI